MTDIERKAALTLFPYFWQRNPIVIDAGSNKGDWAEVLAANVGLMILIEPNTILRHYSQVRFRHLKRVNYFDFALSNHDGAVEFLYFEDEHDGLSNIINNSRWDYLNPLREYVECRTIDSLNLKGMDFLKLDVEGAEWMVLDGARKLLEGQKIKFIQVEYGEHIKQTGKTFADIHTLMAGYGYGLFHFNGVTFERADEPYDSYKAENFYFMDENFSEGWNILFKENTAGMKCDFVLEIGCFEGLTSRYICENILNPGGRMICVDPLTDEYIPNHKDNHLFVGQYDRFIRNTRGYPIELIRKQSQEAREEMFHYRFDLIYVDGDHREESVYRDAQMAFELCKVGGFILFDDYHGYDQGTERGINRFVDEIPTNKMTVVKRNYQLLCQKHENLY